MIDAADFTDPRIEVELAFVLKDRLAGEDATLEDVMQATDYVIPALELIAARTYRVDPDSGYVRRIQDTISDNAASGGVILGEQRIEPDSTDLRWCGAVLYRNGEVEETGLAAGVLTIPPTASSGSPGASPPTASPWNPARYCCRARSPAPCPARPGDVFRADYGNQGSIECRFR